ncbi:hypothetical protein GCM10010038_29740 [Glutamicibacter protophormiae]|nr:hypothetical protein GCM10010038_29740 [Glutamicibacter protophormiae]
MEREIPAAVASSSTLVASKPWEINKFRAAEGTAEEGIMIQKSSMIHGPGFLLFAECDSQMIVNTQVDDYADQQGNPVGLPLTI